MNKLLIPLSSLNIDKKEVLTRLKNLASKNKVKKVIYNKQIFWKLNELKN